jgi:hypothetical protein
VVDLRLAALHPQVVPGRWREEHAENVLDGGDRLVFLPGSRQSCQQVHRRDLVGQFAPMAAFAVRPAARSFFQPPFEDTCAPARQADVVEADRDAPVAGRPTAVASSSRRDAVAASRPVSKSTSVLAKSLKKSPAASGGKPISAMCPRQSASQPGVSR